VVLSSASAQAGARPRLAASADSNDWNAYYDRGVVQLRSNPAIADELFRWAARLDPSRPEPLYARWVAFHVRNPGRFARYLRAEPSTLSDPALHAADSLQMRALARNPFLHRGLVAAAYAQLPGSWARDPFTVAFLKYATGDLPGAADDLALVVRRSPGSVTARHALALALANLRRYDESRAELEAVLATLRRREEGAVAPVYQSKALLMYSIGLLYLAQNRYGEAREAFAQAAVEDASRWYVHRGLGLTQRVEGRVDDALSAYRMALELAPDEPLLLSEYAQALSDAGRHAEAGEQLSRLVRIAPEWANAWRTLGEANLRAGRKAEAAEAFTAYLARAPRSDADAIARVRAQLAELRAAAPE
jgi:tetratricopeptide (TPR) repeat protein